MAATDLVTFLCFILIGQSVYKSNVHLILKRVQRNPFASCTIVKFSS